MAETHPTCPHCAATLKRWLVPAESSWVEEYFLVCFNNDCPYYREGWSWMREQYQQRASYRYAFNPATGSTLMIPVWSDDATREMIDEPEDGTA